MGSSETRFGARSESRFSSGGVRADSVDQEPSADRAAEENSTKRTRTEDNYSSPTRNRRFYGQYDHRASVHPLLAFLGVPCMDVIFPSANRHILSQVLDEVFDGLYGYAMVLSPDPTHAHALLQSTRARTTHA